MRITLATLALAALLAAVFPGNAPAAPVIPAAPGALAPGDSAAVADAPAPGWPLRLSTRFLTSNFMEPREGRFHAGIDLKTDERTGLPAVAVEDGWVGTLRASPEGYGRNLILHGASGRIYLYAHLWRFADRLRPLVETAQRRAGRYRVEVELPRDSVRVARGEVLALTGESGTTGPHLHFEVRSAGGEAINPLRAGFAVRDTFPPRIVRLRAIPAGPGAMVDGQPVGKSIAPPAGMSGLPSLRVHGPVAFAAEIHEQTDVKGHALAAYALTVRCDSVVMFSAQDDSFPLASTAARRLEWLESGEVRAQWLLRRPQDALPGRAGGLWAAADSGLAPGNHRLELEVLDAVGNRAVASWILSVAAPGEPQFSRGGGEAVNAAGAAAAHWMTDPVDVLVLDGAGPRVALSPFVEMVRQGEGWITLDPLRPQDAGPPAPAMWRRLVLEPGPETPLLASTAAYIGPDSVGRSEAGRLAARTGLVALGPVAKLVAADWPAAGPVPVPWPGSGPPRGATRNVAAYREGDPGAWEWIGPLESAAAPDSGLVLPAAGPGRYALLRDARPPEIGAASAGGIVRRQSPRRIAGVTLPRWEVLDVAVADSGSGIAPASVAVTLDGARLIAEPDLIHARVRIELPDRTTAGRHLLTLTVTDRAGNATRRKLSIICRAVD